ncbi:nitroreductase-like protein [Candidatus Phytoplasma mali]|uniref:Nitroreductase-like protein n=1 Tax=Phytoplasma mali (strain AT) TaxID=482235 RepID=B3QZT7_PHYMT|nr:hypothetical protein [Candidatus Phytoplasma mali]AAA18505.1 ORF [Phytoplasma sp.]CAP18474.1 nitroreductase-like protein [Candidatus Phytoplasma mali]
MKIINQQKKNFLVLFILLILTLTLTLKNTEISANMSKLQQKKISNLIDETNNNFKTFKKKFNAEFNTNLQKTKSMLIKGVFQVYCKEKNINELEIYINNLKYFNQQLS